MSKSIYEFYYRIGDWKPSAQYRLDVDRETELTYFGRAVQIDNDGNKICDVGRFRVYKGEENEASLARSERNPTVRVRIESANFQKAKTTVAKMAAEYLHELANRIYKDENSDENNRGLPVAFGDSLFEVTSKSIGCHGCVHGMFPRSSLCTSRCPDDMFTIKEVIVDDISKVCIIHDDGRITLKDCYAKTMEAAKEMVSQRRQALRENKLFFDRAALNLSNTK